MSNTFRKTVDKVVICKGALTTQLFEGTAGIERNDLFYQQSWYTDSKVPDTTLFVMAVTMYVRLF